MAYTLNPQIEQDSITAFLRSQYTHPVIEDGLMDAQIYTIPGGTDVAIPTFPDGSVKPFIILWFSQMKRASNGRSFSSYKLDSHYATVDIVVVTRDATSGRRLLNDIGDKLVGFQTDGGGRMHKGSALWGDSRQVIDDDNRPTRWARTDRFDFGISSRKVMP